MLSLKVKNVMHQKHKVTNYCSQGCYGEGTSGKNEKAKKLTSPSTFSPRSASPAASVKLG